MRYISIFLLLFSFCGFSYAQKDGGIDTELLQKIQKSYKDSPEKRAIGNAIRNNNIKTLAVSQLNYPAKEYSFSDMVESIGISDQQSSGRCWLYTGLNVLRAEVMEERELGEFHFSQTYNFFWDQLEKSNLFLQSIIDTKALEMTDRKVEWLFRNALSDGGQFTGVSDLISKYGLVPYEVMPDTYSSNNTSQMSMLLNIKLKEFALELRMLAAQQGKSPALGEGYAPVIPEGMQRAPVKPLNDQELAELLEYRKGLMLEFVYEFLVLNLGEPPVNFTWENKEYTPHSFYDEYVGKDLQNIYVMIMNDPTRDYYKCYEIEQDRHVYDGHNWKYINLPMEDIKKMAIKSIKGNTMMYYSCDVGKFLDSKNGVLDLNNFDYESLMGTRFSMNKRERILTGSSGSSHAMTLVAVDLDKQGQPTKWLVENSWGMSGYKGHLVITDEWFDEYSFRLVIEKKYVDPKILKILDQEATMLPPWDPMFAPEL